MTMLYEQARVTDTNDPEDRGRVRVKFHRIGMETERWIPLVDSFFSAGDNGWDGELAKGDDIVVSFFDYPHNQQPFVFGKVRSKNQSNKRNGKETMKVKGHKVVFTDDEVDVEHKNGLTKVSINNMAVEINSNGVAPFTVVRSELLEAWLRGHVHIGNLGFPVLPTEASGFPWNPEIRSGNIKIS